MSLELRQIQVFCNCCEIYLLHNILTGSILPTGNLKTRRQPASLLKMGPVWDFPGGPVVKTPHLGAGSIPGQRTKILQAAKLSQKEKNKKHGPVHNYVEHKSFRINLVICTFYKNKGKNAI